MTEKHHKEVKNHKDLWQATEKIKRDQWINEKTKLIKSQTIKGLGIYFNPKNLKYKECWQYFYSLF